MERMRTALTEKRDMLGDMMAARRVLERMERVERVSNSNENMGLDWIGLN